VAGGDRECVYSEFMKKLIIALAVAGMMALILLVAGTARNHGCLPWQTAVTTGGGVFSEGDRGKTYCR
jgi:hypothetical protein